MTVVGIDFGTSNSCVSFFDGYHSKVIPNDIGEYTTPTIIAFGMDSDEILYGEMALNVKENFTIIDNVKRLIGSDKLYNIVYNNEVVTFTINHIIGLYIIYLMNISQTFLQEKISDVVITVPAYFTNIQRNIIKISCESIGLNVLRMINEPTSAILAYYEYSDSKLNVEDEMLLVIDCGGGTTDFSLVQADYNEMLFEVIDTYGDNLLGGDDITNNIADYVRNKIKKDHSNLTFSNKQDRHIKYQCEIAKKNASYNDTIVVYLENIADKDWNIKLTHFEFLDINTDFFQKIRSCILSLKDIKGLHFPDKIIFVGGTTKIPYFKTICHDIFGDNIIIEDKINPDNIVSIGAAIQGALLTDNVMNKVQNETVLLDITPMTLGIKTVGDIMTPIISKGSIIPTSKTQIFTNSEDFVSSIEIVVYQGDKRFIQDNSSLGSFTITDLDSSLLRGHMYVHVTFTINSNSILSVSAKVNGINKTIVVENYKKEHIDKNEYVDEYDKIQDLELSSKTLAKNDLQYTLQSLYHNEYKNEYNEYKNEYNEYKNEYNDYKNEYKNEYNEYKNDNKNDNKNEYNEYKNDNKNEHKNDNKNEYNEYKNEYNDNKRLELGELYNKINNVLNDENVSVQELMDYKKYLYETWSVIKFT
jgi:molecular chaperone DnaK (HSP70)